MPLSKHRRLHYTLLRLFVLVKSMFRVVKFGRSWIFHVLGLWMCCRRISGYWFIMLFHGVWWAEFMCWGVVAANLNLMTTTVTLSRERLNKAFLRIYSTPIPIYWWTLSYSGVPIVISLSFTLIHTHSATSSFESLSKIPSLPITIKSHSSGSKRNERISGMAITTCGFPPTAEILASRSPKVLQTESLPGRTL